MARKVRAKDKPELNIQERPKAAVYSTLHSQRDKRAVELLQIFCAISGLRCVFYLDKSIPKIGQPPGRQQLLEDIAKGLYDIVITWLEEPGMKGYCEQYKTAFEIVDPFVYFQSMRQTKTATRRLY